MNTDIANIPTRLIPYLRTGAYGDTTPEERAQADEFSRHFMLVSPAAPDSRFMDSPAFGGPAPCTPYYVESRYRYTGIIPAPLSTSLHNCTVYFWQERSEPPVGAHTPDGRRTIGTYLNTMTSVLSRNDRWTAFAVIRNGRVLFATHDDIYLPASLALPALNKALPGKLLKNFK